MNTTQSEPQKNNFNFSMPLPKEEHGFYNNATVLIAPKDVFNFCKQKGNVEKVLTDLPMGFENFLDLTLVSAEQTSQDRYEIKWNNKLENKTSGTLSFELIKAPHHDGTILIAEAVFESFKVKSHTPSDLMKFFVKRLKALLETGVIATTKGQPSGREEIGQQEEKIIH